MDAKYIRRSGNRRLKASVLGLAGLLCGTGLLGKGFNGIADHGMKNNSAYQNWQYDFVKDNFISKYDDYFLGFGAGLYLIATPFVLRGITKEEEKDKSESGFR